MAGPHCPERGIIRKGRGSEIVRGMGCSQTWGPPAAEEGDQGQMAILEDRVQNHGPAPKTNQNTVLKDQYTEVSSL